MMSDQAAASDAASPEAQDELQHLHCQRLSLYTGQRVSLHACASYCCCPGRGLWIRSGTFETAPHQSHSRHWSQH